MASRRAKHPCSCSATRWWTPATTTRSPALSPGPTTYYPYGLDFPPRGAATGRFCNGKTVVDALSHRHLSSGDLLGLEYVPPYTTPGLNGTALLGGVNYASAAGGILDETGRHLGDRFSLSQQVLNLESNLNAIRSQFGDEDDRSGYERHLARSVAVMVLGGNDYINNYLLAPLYDSGDRYTLDEYAGLLLDLYARQILVSLPASLTTH
ncbi:GDSL esterase/lipase At1g71250-like [Panicum hallii]|uniref:GDSL esterase/lipase At1g71250-like n=1 Tax=Panicum hallii TaxID=206008 RepID=UPI000DF4E28B|nr:GDSL esterase/lipase At1g71250-like [Panicum hallii]